MNKRTDTEVIINNKRYTLCGNEGEDYLQKIASYINSKITDLKQQEYYRMMDLDLRNVLLQINLADDYFKAKKQLEGMEEESNHKSNEIYNLKHEMIEFHTKLEFAEREMERMKQQNLDLQKQIVKLETELSLDAEKDKESLEEELEVIEAVPFTEISFPEEEF